MDGVVNPAPYFYDYTDFVNKETHIDIKDIFRNLEPELKDFDKIFQDYLRSGIFLIDQINRFIVKGQGKKFRPALTFLCAKGCGNVSELTTKAALIVELLHTATLVHDDMVDDSDKRRGFPSVVRIWKNKVAVLYGDYLLAHSLTAMLELQDLRVFEILSRTARRLSKGELLQAAKTRKLDITEEIYFRMIADKTAALISASTELGCLTGGGNEEQMKALRFYGENLGIAFQIRDDVLDFEGGEGLLGKPVGADLRDKKITLPLIFTLEQLTPIDRERILRKVKRRKDSAQIIGMVRSGGGLEYAMNKAKSYSDSAVKYLECLPESENKEMLTVLADYAIRRKK